MTRAEELARLRPRLLAFALRRAASREQAEDAVQDALLAGLEGLDRYAAGAALGTWLTGILKHKLLDAWRAAYREAPLEALGAEPAHAGPGPEEASAARSALAALERALGSLPPRAAQVFVMRQVLGLEVTEVCARLSITEASCWVALHRAKAGLRASLSGGAA